MKPVMEPARTQRPGRRERRKAQTREAIVEAALELFARQGYFETTVEQITELADVGKGTFFNYFTCKEGVLGGLGDRLLNRVNTGVNAALRRGTAARKAFQGLFHQVTGWYSGSPELLRNLFVGCLASDYAQEHLAGNLARAVESVARLVARAQEKGEIRNDRPADLLARLFFGGVFGAMHLWTLEPSRKLHDWMEQCFDHFWEGVEPEAEGLSAPTAPLGGVSRES